MTHKCSALEISKSGNLKKLGLMIELIKQFKCNYKLSKFINNFFHVKI